MKLVYCSANIYLLVYISHFLPIISRRHLKHTADKCTCAWEFKKPFIFCFITLRYIQAKINEQTLLFFGHRSFRRNKNQTAVMKFYFFPETSLHFLMFITTVFGEVCFLFLSIENLIFNVSTANIKEPSGSSIYRDLQKPSNWCNISARHWGNNQSQALF